MWIKLVSLLNENIPWYKPEYAVNRNFDERGDAERFIAKNLLSLCESYIPKGAECVFYLMEDNQVWGDKGICLGVGFFPEAKDHSLCLAHKPRHLAKLMSKSIFVVNPTHGKQQRTYYAEYEEGSVEIRQEEYLSLDVPAYWSGMERGGHTFRYGRKPVVTD
jgi:hypothetical protein